MTNARQVAYRCLQRIDHEGAYANLLLQSELGRSKLSERDRGFVTELVYGTTRMRRACDALIERFLTKEPQPSLRTLLRLGAYQLMFLDRVPVHAAVDESVKLAHKYGHPGTAGLVNSVLRRLADDKDTIEFPAGDDLESLAIWGSHPLWMVERWLPRFGVDVTRALMLANNRPARLGLRANLLRGTREQLIERLAREEVAATPAEHSPDLVWADGARSPAELAAFRDGACTAQDESEALVGHLLAPQAHERLLDLCAAPGGKCTHIAELVGDEADVWAMEPQRPRLAAIEQALARLGIQSVHVVEGDGRTYDFPMPFDRVLVDAPCSGLGVLGRRADARWRKQPDLFHELPPLQLDLLAAAARRARPGGVVVYSVCSFEPEETDVIVERFLRQQPNMVLESAQGLLPDAVVDDNGFMRVLPHVHGCDGAFAARFRKT